MSGRYPSPGYYEEPGYDDPGHHRIPAQGHPAYDYYTDPPPPPVALPAPTAAPPALAPAPAAPRRRRTTIMLAAVGAVLVLCGVGAWLVARPYAAEWPAKLSKPERLAGLELSTEPALEQSANEIAAAMRRDVKVHNVVAAYYHDPVAEQRLVGLVGSTAFIMSPKAELDEAFRASGGMAITGVRDIDPGPMGGLARCGSAERPGEGGAPVPVSVCAWADHGSFVIGIFYHRPVEESAELLRTIRAEILRR